MANIFHYTSFESALKIIETASLKSTNPSKLNDPFECSPYIKTREDYVKEKSLDPLIEEHIERKTSLYSGGYEEWNKRGNGVELKEFLKQEMDPSKIRFQETVGRKMRFISFSRVGNIVPMWAHYCKNHTGVVLEYDITEMPFSELPLIDVKYSSNRAYWDPLEKSLLPNEKYHESFHEILRLKDSSWGYEREVRIILPTTIISNPETSKFAYGRGDEIFLRFLPRALKSIFLGMRIDEVNQQIIKRLVGARFPHISCNSSYLI